MDELEACCGSFSLGVPGLFPMSSGATNGALVWVAMSG